MSADKVWDQREMLVDAGMWRPGTSGYAPGRTSMTSNTAPLVPQATTIDDILAMVKKLQDLPKPKWLLVAPDGRTWAEVNPAKLAGVIMAHSDLTHLGAL